MKHIVSSILLLSITLLCVAGCTQRSYIMSFDDSDRPARSASSRFTTPVTVVGRDQSPDRVEAPVNESHRTKIAAKAPAAPAIIADDATTSADQYTVENAAAVAAYDHSFSGNETEHVKFSTYDPFSEGSDSFSIDLADAASNFTYPIDGRFSSDYGRRGRGNHTGVDLVAPAKTPIYAAFDGTVRLAKPYSGYGNAIVVRHSNGLETLYAHNSKNLVAVGQSVRSGEQIAECGRTGRATTEHLHFEVRVKGQAINPNLLIDPRAKTIQSGTLKISKSGNGVTARLINGKAQPAGNTTVLASSAPTSTPEKTTPERLVVSHENVEAPTTASTVIPSPRQSKGVRVGDVIYDAPATTEPEKTEAKYHTIVSGDTLGGVAQKYKTTVSALCSLNNMSKNDVIRLGKKLRIK